MAAKNFERAFSRLMGHEGKNSSNKADPAAKQLLPGESVHTRYGITQGVYSAWLTARGRAVRPVRLATLDEAKAIFKAQYWTPVRADDLPSGLDWAVADASYNSGASRAAKFLQASIGAREDGQVGEKTIAAVHDHDPSDLINAVCDARLRFLRKLTTWGTFGRGWTRRVAEVRSAALTMAAGEKLPAKQAPLPAGELGAERKTLSFPEIKNNVVTAAGAATTAVGKAGEAVSNVDLTTAGETTKQLAETATSLSAVFQWAVVVGAVIMAIGIVLVFLGGLKRKNAEVRP